MFENCRELTKEEIERTGEHFRNKRVLFGGSNDGQLASVEAGQRSFFIQSRIGIVETQMLKIDAVTSWKHPEDLYEIKENGEFHFVKKISYNPDFKG